jgi:hypothetical protein
MVLSDALNQYDGIVLENLCQLAFVAVTLRILTPGKHRMLSSRI